MTETEKMYFYISLITDHNKPLDEVIQLIIDENLDIVLFCEELNRMENLKNRRL